VVEPNKEYPFKGQEPDQNLLPNCPLIHAELFLRTLHYNVPQSAHHHGSNITTFLQLIPRNHQ
jgi:hypothetical protein